MRSLQEGEGDLHGRVDGGNWEGRLKIRSWTFLDGLIGSSKLKMKTLDPVTSGRSCLRIIKLLAFICLAESVKKLPYKNVPDRMTRNRLQVFDR
jgi:hypothetical protein